MTDPVGLALLVGVGLFALTLGVIGLKRGKVVAAFDWSKSEKPGLFWYGIVFQCGLGAVCLGLGIAKMFGIAS